MLAGGELLRSRDFYRDGRFEPPSLPDRTVQELLSCKLIAFAAAYLQQKYTTFVMT
jgi:hypothetical protein